MEKPLNEGAAERDELSILKHDIRNQLSNIFLALDQLKYEMTGATEDDMFYLDTIAASCQQIDALLKAK